MGVTYKGLYQPATSEVGWQTTVNTNFATIADNMDEFLPAGTGVDHNGAAPALFGTFPNAFPYFLCADSAVNGASWVLRMPDAFSPAGVSCAPVWTPTVTDSAAHTVRWSFNIRQIVAGGDLGSVAAGTQDTVAWTSTSVAHGANVVFYDAGATSTGVVTFAAGNVIRVSLSRLGTDSLDTFLAGVRLLGVTIGYV